MSELSSVKGITKADYEVFKTRELMKANGRAVGFFNPKTEMLIKKHIKKLKAKWN